MSGKKNSINKYYKRQFILLTVIGILIVAIIGVTLFFVFSSGIGEISQSSDLNSAIENEAAAADGKESSVNKSEIRFEQSRIEIQIGQTVIPEVVGGNLSDIYKWASSDVSVASVSDKGEITGVGAGIAAITAEVEGTDTFLNLAVSVVPAGEKPTEGEESSTEESSGGSGNYTPNGFEIVVKDGKTYIDGILMASKTYTLPESFDPGADSEALAAFDEMKEDAAAEGLDIYISSGYRSYADQDRIYNNYVARDGSEEADKYSSRPGHSDHQTGLAFDLNSIDDSFGYTPESDWVKVNAHKYGFIVRYPEGKADITGYQYEPWHIRYLGVDKATKVYESGLSLEEYLGVDSKYE